MLRVEARNAATPVERKPPWIKIRARFGPEYRQLKDLVHRGGLHTVCEEARCPNIGECWNHRTATFLLLGEVCTRGCRYCAIAKGKPGPLDRQKPSGSPRRSRSWAAPRRAESGQP